MAYLQHIGLLLDFYVALRSSWKFPLMGVTISAHLAAIVVMMRESALSDTRRQRQQFLTLRSQRNDEGSMCWTLAHVLNSDSEAPTSGLYKIGFVQCMTARIYVYESSSRLRRELVSRPPKETVLIPGTTKRSTPGQVANSRPLALPRGRTLYRISFQQLTSNTASQREDIT